QVAGVKVGQPIPVNGAGSYAVLYTIDKGAGNYTITATLTPTATIAGGSSGNGTLTVNPAITSLAWPAPAGIAYGTVLSSTQLNVTATAAGGNVAGTFVYSPPAGTVLQTGNNQTLSV